MVRKGDYSRAAELYAEALNYSAEIGGRRDISECFEGLAHLACGERRYNRAGRLFGAADALRKSIGAGRMLRQEQASYDHDFAAARAALGEAAFAVALGDGRVMTLKQAIEYALAPDVQ